MVKARRPAILALADGAVFHGYAFGAQGEASGEVCFNTGMVGYQEVLTDPSYRGQIVTMTYPEIGNYGINPVDMESWQPWVEGFVVREYNDVPSNWRSEQSLGEYLSNHGIVGISDIDTRRLTAHLRTHGWQMGIISTERDDEAELIEDARGLPPLSGRDLVREVVSDRARRWGPDGYVDEPDDSFPRPEIPGSQHSTSGYRYQHAGADREPLFGFRVVVIDCGVKQNILRHLVQRRCEVIVAPAGISAERVLEWNPHGVVLSNGPGDPEAVTSVIRLARDLIGKLPMFGICLGQQILGLAYGGKTYKLKFGHRGCNHPVRRLETGTVEITTQNHGFCVDPESLPDSIEITHINLNDQTLEGMRHRDYPVFSVQYHPEAAPGPHDANYLFDIFIDYMREANE
ncbi:MAG: glutamine-hydrolyzing carbamoyl-phosphate synthase small subunit [Armatimonadetes bacterium]|nr:glutamine-hydrolyzing carbamoyl-phosphate synthase small subunit [Armatimonadota bacterium]